jgi:hypothetical protein
VNKAPESSGVFSRSPQDAVSLLVMPTPAALHVARCRRGNPKNGSGLPLVPQAARPTEFEMQARELGLTPEMYATSRELKAWCKRNKNHHYIPEWLLKTWNINVNSDIGTAA